VHDERHFACVGEALHVEAHNTVVKLDVRVAVEVVIDTPFFERLEFRTQFFSDPSMFIGWVFDDFFCSRRAIS